MDWSWSVVISERMSIQWLRYSPDWVLFYVAQSSSASNVMDCIFTSNNASLSGGAIHAEVRSLQQYSFSEGILQNHLLKLLQFLYGYDRICLRALLSPLQLNGIAWPLSDLEQMHLYFHIILTNYSQ